MEKIALIYVLLFFGGAFAILTVFLIFHFYDMQIHYQPYGVTFDGKSTFSDNGVTAVISRAANESQYITIYGLTNPSSTLLTDLVDENGRKVQSNNKIFGIVRYPDASEQNASSTFLMTVNEKGPGSFSGYLVATGPEQSNVSIPVAVATRPIIAESIILVIIGVMISVCVWEIIRYLRSLEKENNKPELEEKVGVAKAEARNANENALEAFIQSQLIEIKATTSKLSCSEIGDLKRLRPTIDENLREAAIKDAEASILQEKLAEDEAALIKYETRNKSPLKSAGRIAFIELAPSLFGIFIAMFSVFNDQAVIGAVVATPLLVTQLVGLGLATGSLKELID